MIGLVLQIAVAATPLTADEAVAAAVQHSAPLEAQRVQVDLEQVDRTLPLRPLELRLGHRALDGWVVPIEKNGVRYAPLDETYATLGWRLPEPWRVARLLTGADDAAAANDELEDAKVALAVEVRQVHGRLVAQRAEIELRREAVRLAELLERIVGEQAEARATTVLDARLAGLDRLDAVLALTDAQADARVIEQRLATLTGLAAPLDVVAAPSTCAPPPAIEPTVTAALERSSRVRALRARVAAASSRVSWSWIRFLPWLDSVQLGYFNEPLDKRDEVRGAIDLALPVFELGAKERRDLELRLRQLQIRLRDEEESLRTKLAGVIADQEAAWQAKRVLDEASASLVAASIADVEAALAAGQADALRVAEVRARALRARIAQLRADQRCNEAGLELVPRASGARAGAPQVPAASDDAREPRAGGVDAD